MSKPKNQTELARELGVSRRTVATWSRYPGAPKPTANGSHDLEAWREFIRANGLKESDTPDLQRLKARRLEAQCKSLEFSNEVQRREFIHADEVRRTFARMIGACKSRLLNFPRRLAQEFALMDDAIAIEEKMTGAIHEALSELSRGEWARLHCQHCGEEVRP